MSGKNKTPSAEVIQGPWGKSKRKVKLPDTNTAKVQENLAFADDLTEILMVQLIHTMHENGFDVNGKTFVKSMGFVIESVKASIYKEMSLTHPMNRIMDILSTITVEADETTLTGLDMKKLDDMTNSIQEDDDGPEMA